MNDGNATKILLKTIHKFEARGDFLELADIYRMATDPELKAIVESAINEAVSSFAMVRSIWCTEHARKIEILITDYYLPETTLVIIAGFLERIEPRLIFSLRDKSHSKEVTTACDDALIRAIGMLESNVEANPDAAQTIAIGWKEKELSARVVEARDAALARIIQKWAEEAKGDNILNLSAVEGISPSVKDAAAAALSLLDKLPEAQFAEAVEGLGYCSDLEFLASQFEAATSPASRKAMENAMLLAMDIAYNDSGAWEMTCVNAAMMCEYAWKGSRPFEKVLKTGSDMLKQKATKILSRSRITADFGVPSLPEVVAQKRSEYMPRRESYQRMVKLYLLQERHRNRDQLSEGTVNPPAKGTSEPAGRRTHSIRHR